MSSRLRFVLAAAVVLLVGLVLAALPLSPAWAGSITLGSADRLLVVAPHPDDETLGAGGLIQLAQEVHAPVRVVVVTNGDGSTPAAAKLSRTPLVTPSARIKLGRTRQAESLAALAVFGVPRESVQFLGYPDKLLSLLWEDHWKTPYFSLVLGTERGVYADAHTPHAPFSGAAVRDDLVAIIRAFRPTVVVIPSALDLHPDHRAAALFTQQALFDTPTLHPRLYAYLVHRGPWPPAGPYLPVPESALASQLEWSNLALQPGWVTKKAEAIKLYKTQMAISPTYLLSLAKPNELFSEVRQVRLSGAEAMVSRESEARAGLRDVAVDHEQLLKIKNPGVWNVLARVEGGNLYVRLTAVAPKLAPSEYTFLVRDGDHFVKITTDQSAMTIPVKGEKFFLAAQVADARGHVVALPWVACERRPSLSLLTAAGR